MAALDRVLETVALGEPYSQSHPPSYPHMGSSWPRVNIEMLSSPPPFAPLNVFFKIKTLLFWSFRLSHERVVLYQTAHLTAKATWLPALQVTGHFNVVSDMCILFNFIFSLEFGAHT